MFGRSSYTGMFGRGIGVALSLWIATGCGRIGYSLSEADETIDDGGAGEGAGGSGGSAGSEADVGAAGSPGGQDTGGSTSTPDASVPVEPELTYEAVYNDFSDLTGVHLLPIAQQLGSAIELTADTINARGAFHLEQPMTWTSTSRLSVEFSFRINATAQEPADGLVFMLHDDPRGLDAIGDGGGALGYADGDSPIGIRPSIAVEYDIFGFTNDDPSTDHLAIVEQGNVGTPLILANPLPVPLRSGQRTYSWVDYSEAQGQMEVYLADSPNKPATPLMVLAISLLDTVGNRMFIGLSASTGASQAQHLIEHLIVRQYAE